MKILFFLALAISFYAGYQNAGPAGGILAVILNGIIMLAVYYAIKGVIFVVHAATGRNEHG